MSICLTINAEDPEMLQRFVRGLASSMAPAAAQPEIVPPNGPSIVEEVQGDAIQGEAPKKNRRKAPAADAVIDQAPAQTDIEEVTGTPDDSFPMLTIEDARERMKVFAKDGHMDCVEAALAHFSVKKVSDVDPDAVGKPSRKFAAFVAKIEALVAAKPAVQE